MSEPGLLAATADRVATLTLNRPETANAVGLELLTALREALRAADGDDAVDVIVLTGAGTAFSCGLDPADLVSPERGPQMAEAVFSSPRAWEPTSKPVIGAINGPAERGGLELALHCDLLIASETATFADTHVEVGIVPALGMTSLLSRRIGPERAFRMSLTGEPMTAAEALTAGLVSEIVPPGELLGATRRLAARIAAQPQVAVRSVLASYRTVERALAAVPQQIEFDTHQRFLEAAPPSTFVDSMLGALRARRRRESSD